MPAITLTVRHKLGLHARPAALFVKTAQSFTSNITVSKSPKSVNAKSILLVLTLGVTQGQQITITAEGPDAAAALQALSDLINNNFGEAEA
jgi:phosphotransferase system HPr (HPr) family protein